MIKKFKLKKKNKGVKRDKWEGLVFYKWIRKNEIMALSQGDLSLDELCSAKEQK